ncbi:MAG: HAD-IIA family hydrolase [Acidimicrobiia bacterium]
MPIDDLTGVRSLPVAVLCDLDGVVWLSHHPIAGSVEAIAALRAADHRVLFVTNNSFSLVEEQEAALAAIGIPAVGDVLTSALAAAELVEPGERVHVCGGPGIVQALERRGAVVVTEGACDAVLVGFHRSFDYEGLRRAATAVIAGARLIGTNDDATYPTPDGPIPGGGSLLAAVATASGASPVIAGKPYAPMAALVRAVLGVADQPGVTDAVMVGDRPSTDGRFARALGCPFALVWSGVTAAGTVVEPVPDLVAANLAAIAAQLLAREDQGH